MMSDYTRFTAALSTNAGVPKRLWLCQDCGSVVADQALHDGWHRKFIPEDDVTQCRSCDQRNHRHTRGCPMHPDYNPDWNADNTLVVGARAVTDPRTVTLPADQVTALATEDETLRQVIAEIKALHAPVQIGVLPGDAFEVCAACCYADDEDRRNGWRTRECADWHHHGDPYPICPTAAILDRAGL